MEWNNIEKKLFRKINTPAKIQDFLDKIEYDEMLGTASPRYVILEERANCFEGAIFAAAALEYNGYEPLIVDMIAENDDDHVIAVYKWHNHWGAVAKSNTTVLKYREPVYLNVRELVMSYFDFYMNTAGEKTLRKYSNPVNLRKFDKKNWRITSEDLEFISDYLYSIKHHNILKNYMIKNLKKENQDSLLLKATLLGSKKSGLYKPK
ncbi:MAG: hypothetical protein QXK76_02370 [Candidatus Woesearchaeota archaeon]